ncbi:MAG: DUF3095 family protein [Kofleriaceae bacterium]|nr:DUF3095 family protein [Kofleriaceae bacterium]
MADRSFYRDLESFQHFADLCEERVWHRVPDSWHLARVQVHSEKAYTAQVCLDINSVAMAAIAAAKNSVSDTVIPWWVHESGCTILVPALVGDSLHAAMRGVKKMASEVFELELEAVIIPVSALNERDGELELGRYAPNTDTSWAVIRGRGMRLSDSLMSDSNYLVGSTGRASADFSGFEDRFQPIKSRFGKVVSVVVRSMHQNLQAQTQVYERVLAEVKSLSQVTDQACPISADELRFAPTADGFVTESEIRGFGEEQTSRKIRQEIQAEMRAQKSWLQRLGIGALQPKSESYLATTDFMSFCGCLRMNLDLRHGQLQRLREVLQVGEDHGHLVYGIHTADHSFMRALRTSAGGRHYVVHGGVGGFELASRRISARLKDLNIIDDV